MEKKPDFHLEIPPELRIDESEDTIILPKPDPFSDDAVPHADTSVFRTQEILSMIEKRISEGPKHRKRNRVKDVFKQKKRNSK